MTCCWMGLCACVQQPKSKLIRFHRSMRETGMNEELCLTQMRIEKHVCVAVCVSSHAVGVFPSLFLVCFLFPLAPLACCPPPCLPYLYRYMLVVVRTL